MKNISLRIKLPLFLGVSFLALFVVLSYLRVKDSSLMTEQFNDALQRGNTIALNGIMQQQQLVLDKQLNSILYTDELVAFLQNPSSQPDKMVLEGLFLSLQEDNCSRFVVYDAGFQVVLQAQVQDGDSLRGGITDSLRAVFLQSGDDLLPHYFFRLTGSEHKSLEYTGVVAVTDDSDKLIGFVALARNSKVWLEELSDLTGSEVGIFFSAEMNFGISTKPEMYTDFADQLLEDVPVTGVVVNRSKEEFYLSSRLVVNDSSDLALASIWLTRIHSEQIAAEKKSNYIQAASLVILIIICGFCMIWAITLFVTRPLSEAVMMIEEMQKGVLTRRLTMNQEDEIGRMAAAMDGFADTLEQVVVQGLEYIAAGDLRFDIVVQGEDDAIGIALSRCVQGLNTMVAEVQQISRQVNQSAGRITDSSQELSQATTESAAAIEEITSSMVTIQQQVEKFGEQAKETDALSGNSSNATERGGANMQNLVVAMEEINDSGKNISRIIKVIDAIAFQTNLLALNAAVEAARAGQHGKGFAVVAEEVRNLAARSAKAALETTALVETAQERAEHGSSIADKTAEVLDEIRDITLEINNKLSGTRSSSDEQVANITQINKALLQVDETIQVNSSSAEQGAMVAAELASQAVYLEQIVHRFKIKELPRTEEI